jgi:hypothetical protein
LRRHHLDRYASYASGSTGDEDDFSAEAIAHGRSRFFAQVAAEAYLDPAAAVIVRAPWRPAMTPHLP